MCGIAGVWTDRKADPSHLRDTVFAMTQALAHRGPDGSGVWCDAQHRVALGHRRLAIIDLSDAAGQPMEGPSGTTQIVFNGEIYNYRELRTELVADGTRLRTESDTEVVVALYEKYGVDSLPMLRGMFAFAIWDARRSRLVLARDRVGKKPLYYARVDQQLVFGSELKALWPAISSDDRQIDERAIDRFLTFGFVNGPGTVYRHIRQVPPGCVLVADAPERFTVWPYVEPGVWNAHGHSTVPIDDIDATLADAVRLRLRADVPVAAFLSGGIDSGLVTAYAAQHGTALSTFTVGFDDESFDERPLARLVSQRFGTHHHEIAIRPDVERLLPSIVRAYDQPFADASAVPSYCVAEAVSARGFKVVLNGDGGDELFGGYRRALAAAWLGRAERAAGKHVVRAAARGLRSALPSPRQHRTSYAFAERIVRGAAESDLHRTLAWSADCFSAADRSRLGMAAYDAGADMDGIAQFLPEDTTSPLALMMTVDLRFALPYGLLVKMDIATMAHGLEGRSPFLDQELIALQMTTPVTALLPGISTKPVLRELARRRLPAEVADAPKRGFEPPVHRWLTRELRALRDDLLLSRDGIVCSLVDRRRLERFLQAEEGDPYRWAQHVWALLMLAAWDRFVERETPSATLAAARTMTPVRV